MDSSTTLLRLVPWRRMSTEFGYLLRHYWMPATQLTLRLVTEQSHPDKPPVESTRLFRRTMLQCDADQCVWRDDGITTDDSARRLIRFSRPSADREICYYNRSEQTFRVRPLPGRTRFPDDEHAARNQAFLRQPVLNPLLPIPLGFVWHVRNGGDYLEMTLESAETRDDMTILTIRRRGEFHVNEYFIENAVRPCNWKVIREGVSVYALERAMILEDRTHDRVQGSGEPDGLEIRSTLTLTKSELL